MRNTTALPVRTTPHASAKTLGRPSKTNPTTPSGAAIGLHRPLVVFDALNRRRTPTRRIAPDEQSGDHVRSHPVVQAQPRRRSSRHRQRAPRRPRSQRQSRSNTTSSARAVAKRSKKAEIASSLESASSAKPFTAPRDRIVDQRVDRCRDVKQRAGRLHDDQSITGREPFRQISSDAHHTITAERDLLSGEQPVQWCDLWSRRHRN